MQDGPASADEAEVGSPYAALPLGVVDERGGGGGIAAFAPRQAPAEPEDLAERPPSPPLFTGVRGRVIPGTSARGGFRNVGSQEWLVENSSF